MGYIGNRPADSYTSFAVQHFTTSATTTYSLDNPVANENEIALFINNVRQEPGSSYAYTASGTTLTLSAATSASDTMYCVFIGKAVQTVTPTLPIANFSSTGIDDNADATAITIDSSENVGIGTASPSTKLHVEGDFGSTLLSGESPKITIQTNAGTNQFLELQQVGGASFIGTQNGSNDGELYILGKHTGNNQAKFSPNIIQLYTANSERMRIDSSGTLLIGKTTEDFDSTAGLILRGDGLINCTRSNGNVTDFNRLNSDGEIVRISKDGTDVGSIGSISGNAMYVNAPNDGGGGFLFSNNASTIYPTRRTSGTVGLSDNTNDLGAAVWRFNDAYITNGVTTGSDQNEKQQIQLLTDSEIAVAKRISKGFKTFKWNSAVEEKGDNARIHTGVIAQEVQQAFTDEGLDVTKYAFFMSNTYWEKERVIPAVEEIIDEEGNITQEAQPEHTVIDKWEVESEAPEGAVQKTRLGIRYPELLSFVSSAFEQRLTNIETRLTTLENA